MSGWVSIERKLIMGDHPAFKKGPMTEAQAFAWMIARAAWENTTHRVGTQCVDVPRGSFITTHRQMQTAFLWKSTKKIRGFLTMLENGHMVGRSLVGPKNSEKTQISICNYEEYQGSGPRRDPPRTQKRPTKDPLNKQLNNKQINNPAELLKILDFWAAKINSDEFVAQSSVSSSIARELIKTGRVTPERMKQRGIAA